MYRDMLTCLLYFLKRDMSLDPPPANVIDRAKSIMRSYLRCELPDWVEILANGDPANLAAVIETAKADIKADEVGNANVSS